MERTEIKDTLMRKHREFIDYVQAMDERTFVKAPKGKWHAGQQLSHVLKSLKAVYIGMVMSKFQLKLVFGKANRPSSTYEDLVTRYHDKLAEGYQNREAYMPQEVSFEDRKTLCDKVMSYASRLGKQLDKYEGEELDEYVLPHPLLGKLTIREMAYFAIYHVEHHHKLTEQYAQ